MLVYAGCWVFKSVGAQLLWIGRKMPDFCQLKYVCNVISSAISKYANLVEVEWANKISFRSLSFRLPVYMFRPEMLSWRSMKKHFCTARTSIICFVQVVIIELVEPQEKQQYGTSTWFIPKRLNELFSVQLVKNKRSDSLDLGRSLSSFCCPSFSMCCLPYRE